LHLWIGAELPSFEPSTLLGKNGFYFYFVFVFVFFFFLGKEKVKGVREAGRGATFEKELFCGVEKFVLEFRVGDWVEPSHRDYPLDDISAAVVCVRVASQDAAEKGLEPEAVRGNSLVASLVDAVAFDAPGNFDFDSHVEAGKGIVAAVVRSAACSRDPG
jgi:hypothetical protein